MKKSSFGRTCLVTVLTLLFVAVFGIVAYGTGGGTDAAFAALHARGGVVEGMGLGGFGAHSSNNEYILLGTIVPRLYLVARLVMELSGGAAPAPKAD